MSSNDPYLPPRTAPDALTNVHPPTLANTSLMLVIFPLAASVIYTQAGADPRGAGPVIFNGIVGLLIIAGFLAAIAALITRNGKKGVILRAGAALLISGGLFAIAVPNFMGARERALARNAEERRNFEIMETERAASEKLDFNLRPPASQAISQAAAKMTGKEAIAGRAAAEYMAEVEAAFKAGIDATQSFRGEGPFIAGKATTKAALSQWREKLAVVIASTERFLELHRSADLHLHRALRGKLSEDDIRDFTTGFISSRNRQPAYARAVKLRELDVRGWNAILAIVNVLDRELGSWAPNSNGSWVVAKKLGLQGELDGFLKEFTAAAQEQQKLNQQRPLQPTAQR